MARAQPQSANALTPITFEILLSLAQEPQHGYGIKLSIEQRTAGELTLGSGTLYQAIQRLERSELIAVAEGVAGSEDPRRGRFYRLEPAGKAALEAELKRLNRVLEYARSRDLLPDVPAP